MVSDKQIDEISDFYTSITIPTVVKINKAITQTNAPNYVKESLALLKAKAMNSTLMDLRYFHLTELKRAILEMK